MFFVVSKLLGIVFFHPLNLLAIAALCGLVLWPTRFARAGRAIVAVATLLLAIAAFSPLSALALRPLENRFPPPPADSPAPDGILVLGGAMDEDISLARGAPTLSEAAARLTSGVALSRAYPGAKLVFSGGSADLGTKGIDEARGVRSLWTSLGVLPSRTTFEDRSRNTWENAVMTRAAVHPSPSERWLLVTSAAHMPRAMGIFRREGWNVTAYPVDYRTFGDARDLRPTALGLESLRRLDTAAHEWIGLLAYRLTGKTDALFPAP